MTLRNFKTIKDRRLFIENEKKINLKAISIYPDGLDIASSRNCENMIGAVSVPLGLAGPLKIIAEFARGDYYIPLATTEGALVASVNRGCKAITAAGGAKVISAYSGITRGPIFTTQGIKQGLKIKLWLEANTAVLDRIAQETSSHISLLKTEASVIGRNLFIRYSFDTMDAMGMNMATIAAKKINDYLEKRLKIRCIAEAGNADVDKKPSWLNALKGRGRQIHAEITLDKEICKKVLKTTPAKIHQVCLKKCHLGSIMSGSLGFNAHIANTIAALFIATGQDPAHVAEGSIGLTATELIDSNLYISVYLPDMPLGTVGGGTALPAQFEALNLLGVAGGSQGEKATKFAEILGAAVLAGEISLLAALAEGSLAKAHQTLARI